MSSESSPDDHGHVAVDATVSPISPTPPSPPSDVATQETGGSTNSTNASATPPVQEVPENGMTASTIRAINDDDRPIPVWQVADHEKESEGPQLHDGPPGPPRFPHELDDSLAKKVEKERATSTAFEDRLRHEVIGSRERAAQETGVDTEVGDSTAAPMVQAEVTQGGATTATIRAINDGDPPLPLLQVTVRENEIEGPQLHDGPPGPQYSLSEFDDSLAKRVGNEFEPTSSDHPRDNASTVHSTTGAPVANSAAVGPPMGGGVEEGSAPSGGSALLMSPPTEAATTAVGLNLALSDCSTFVAQAWVEEPEGMPGRGTVYEAEPIEPQMPTVLPFYQQKRFAFVLVAMFLLAVGIATAVPLLNNLDSSNGGANIPTITGYPTNNPTTSNIPASSPSVQAYRGKLLAPDGAPFDYFGASVAVYRDTIVVGAEEDDDNGMRSGSAYVFVRSGDEWTPEAKLLVPDGAAYDFFGHSVAIYGDSIVVGAYWDDDNGSASGSAHVFVRSGKEWTHKAKLLAPDGAADDKFGYSTAIYRDTIVVGAHLDDDNGYWSGSAHVFVQSEGPSQEGWTHQAKLLAPDGAEFDYFGGSVAIYGDIIVVSAYWDDDNGSASGSAHVFVRSGEDWTHEAKLVAPDGAPFDNFGGSVAIYGDAIVIGASLDDDKGDGSGYAYIFVRSGGEWTHQAKLLAPDGEEDDYFGRSVAIYGDTIVVGAFGDDDNGSASGSATVFVRSGEEWTKKVKLLAPDGAADDKFGYSVAIYGDAIVVGANEDDNHKGSNSGSAYVFAVV